MRPDLFGDEPGWEAARDRRSARPPVVYRCAVPPGVEVKTVRAASVVRGFRAGGERSGAVGVMSRHRHRILRHPTAQTV